MSVSSTFPISCYADTELGTGGDNLETVGWISKQESGQGSFCEGLPNVVESTIIVRPLDLKGILEFGMILKPVTW